MSAAPSPTLDLVVCFAHAERRGLLSDCAHSGLRELGADDRLLVVVDGGDELESVARAALPADPRISLWPSERPRGLSGARNTAIAHARADVVVFVDDDATLSPGWADAVRGWFQDDAVGIVGGAVQPHWALGRAPSWFPQDFGWVVGCDYSGMAPHGADVRNPIGAAMAVRRALFAAAGGFRESLGRRGLKPLGGEETEFAIRVRQVSPCRIVRATDWQVRHLVPASRSTLRYFVRRCFWEGLSKPGVWGSESSRRRAHTEVDHLRRVVLPTLVADSRTRGGVARSLVRIVGLGAMAVGVMAGMLTPRAAAVTDGALHSTAAPGTIAVVVCSIGKSPLLAQTIQSLLAQTRPADEILVIDNDPASGAVRAALAGTDPDAVRIVSEPVRGLSRARNRGIRESRSQIIAFTDDDALADPAWIARLEECWGDGAEHVGCVTGRVVPTQTGSATERWFEQAASFDRGDTSHTWSLSPELTPSAPRSAFFPYTAGEFGSGNNMAFRRRTLREVGGFAVALGAGRPTRGGEDLDMFRRVLLAGWHLHYAADAVVRHEHRRTEAALREQFYAWGTGMAASMTRFALTDVRSLLAVAVLVPRAAWMLLDPRSPKNNRKEASFPAALTRAEWWGYLAGPFLYLGTEIADARARRKR